MSEMGRKTKYTSLSIYQNMTEAIVKNGRQEEGRSQGFSLCDYLLPQSPYGSSFNRVTSAPELISEHHPTALCPQPEGGGDSTLLLISGRPQRPLSLVLPPPE